MKKNPPGASRGGFLHCCYCSYFDAADAAEAAAEAEAEPFLCFFGAEAAIEAEADAEAGADAAIEAEADADAAGAAANAEAANREAVKAAMSLNMAVSFSGNETVDDSGESVSLTRPEKAELTCGSAKSATIFAATHQNPGLSLCMAALAAVPHRLQMQDQAFDGHMRQTRHLR
ncbi:hypothetical protein [Pseudoduganella rivuli]|uniref:hypothetical protein n=1 Tax=Pseudoduganella rivuli TaxID=2666085 RepID=UPI0018A1C4BB|nr:hypothetical protein [Pseudoduganella rivuli]